MFDSFTLRTDQENSSAGVAVEEDTRLLTEVHETAGQPVIRLWTNSPSIVVPTRDSRLPEFEQARTTMQQHGYEVAVRSSGGTAVLHNAQVLNASVIFRTPKADKVSMELGYQKLLDLFDLLVPELAGRAYFASIPGAYCDGDYNLVIDGQKIAGTAQRIKSAGAHIDHRTILAHMSLLVTVDALQMEKVINLYYGALKSEVRVREGVSSSIDQFCTGDISCASIIAAFTEAYPGGTITS
ncbi:lipoate--protein ligase family protein [Emcibacter nanhaiensis]|uniref:BPL/LPL catalytic domain-containing protein n=1 Tax=Emcibacter nanhaiensis TaxID=1505037 RepID=A0A501PT20_9PROT|nr:hypothetical protein [Emcibacter nanhaiensis]TPD63202.1 hypothetical protein FIV46_03770 [Emcibacter nanhaiensis]